MIVGRGNLTPTGYARAFVAYGTSNGSFGSLLNLNDPHLSYGLGETLATAEHVNDAGLIVGNGFSYGYVLRTQPLTKQ